jgi:dienelactone hydrolase
VKNSVAIETIEYQAGDAACSGRLVYDERASERRPLLLIAPNWLGVSDEAIRRTEMMCGDRYIGFVADMFGGGRSLSGPDEAAPLANALRGNAPERRRRIAAALDTLVAEADRRGIGHSTRKAAVGFCFGGGNVLELARTGAHLQAVVCLHGDLDTSMPAKAGEIRAALLVLHGSKDPVSPKSQRDVFEAEMDAAGAKWQMLTFGGLVHSFSESEANLRGLAEYNEVAARQSYRLLDQFIQDAFAGRI